MIQACYGGANVYFPDKKPAIEQCDQPACKYSVFSRWSGHVNQTASLAGPAVEVEYTLMLNNRFLQEWF